MCEWASVAQGNSQHRPCGQNAGIWVSPRHCSEGSGQREQPRWLPTATGEWDGGTEDGQCQHRPCCPTSGLSMLLPFPSCRPFRHHLVHPSCQHRGVNITHMQPPDITGYLVFQQGTDMLLINTNETCASTSPGIAPACACKAPPKSWI